MNQEKQESQEKVWDKIAEEWHEFKTSPSQAATEFINKSKGKILDFGSGSGRNLLELKPSKNREFYLVDFSQEMLNRAKERAKKLKLKITTKKSILEKTDFPDNYFDAAICAAAIHCIETSEKRKKAIKELYRILKPGAKADLEVWNKDSERFKKKPKEKFIAWTDKGLRYYYLYEEKEFKKILEKTGFKIIKKIPHKANLIFIVEK
jgi:ubiquinone/menaquinone biosynthesis C-methylase UbiE